MLLGQGVDPRIRYLFSQLLALQVGATIAPVEFYSELEGTHRSGLDFRNSTVLIQRVGDINLKKVTFLGSSQVEMYLGSGVQLNNVLINSGNSRLTVAIGSHCDLTDCVIQGGGRQNYLIIGSGTTIPKGNMLLQEDQFIAIGDDCMFSNDVAIRTSDSHSIFDLATQQRINATKPVAIAEHCWIGRHVNINKGVQIGSDAVVGQGSTLSGRLQPNCLYAGVPARLLREGVAWSRWLADTLEEAEKEQPWKVRLNASASEFHRIQAKIQDSGPGSDAVIRLSRELFPHQEQQDSTFPLAQFTRLLEDLVSLEH